MLRSLQREGGGRRRIWQAPNQTPGGSQSKNRAYLRGLGILRALLGRLRGLLGGFFLCCS